MSEILGKADTASVVLVSELKHGDSLVDTDLHYFVKPKNLELTDPQIKMEIQGKGDNIEVTLTAISLAKNVFLCADGLSGQFSDNYFDILPGQQVLITIPKRDAPSDLESTLKILNLYRAENDD